MTLLRMLWEDDRFGRVSLVMDPHTFERSLLVEVPAGRTRAGEVRWQPLHELDGADSEAAHELLAIIRELAGDVYFYTMPVRKDGLPSPPNEASISNDHDK
ncbi:MAG: hypothetical protein ACYDCO_18845 [Armatimonadota bacterium]